MTSTIDRYTCLKTLGRGLSATVKLASDPTGQKFALKIFDMRDAKHSELLLDTLRQEVAAYEKLEHKNIVQLIHFCEDSVERREFDGREKRVAYMVLEYVESRELFEFCTHGAIKHSVCRALFLQMLQAVHFVHE